MPSRLHQICASVVSFQGWRVSFCSRSQCYNYFSPTHIIVPRRAFSQDHQQTFLLLLDSQITTDSSSSISYSIPRSQKHFSASMAAAPQGTTESHVEYQFVRSQIRAQSQSVRYLHHLFVSVPGTRSEGAPGDSLTLSITLPNDRSWWDNIDPRLVEYDGTAKLHWRDLTASFDCSYNPVTNKWSNFRVAPCPPEMDQDAATSLDLEWPWMLNRVANEAVGRNGISICQTSVQDDGGPDMLLVQLKLKNEGVLFLWGKDVARLGHGGVVKLSTEEGIECSEFEGGIVA